jgi:hypothetical protein
MGAPYHPKVGCVLVRLHVLPLAFSGMAIVQGGSEFMVQGQIAV